MATKKHSVRRAIPKRKPVAKRRRPRGTSQTLKSMATGRAPSARLKKRRAKNRDSGYYPNPIGSRVVAWPDAKAYAVMKGNIILAVFTGKAEAARYAKKVR